MSGWSFVISDCDSKSYSKTGVASLRQRNWRSDSLPSVDLSSVNEDPCDKQTMMHAYTTSDCMTDAVFP